MIANSSRAVSIDKKTHATHFQVGMYAESSTPGALAYQAIGMMSTATAYRTPDQLTDCHPPSVVHSVALALVESPRQDHSDLAHRRLLDLLSPLLGAGSSGLSLAINLLRQSIWVDSHQALLWSDGARARLLFQGDQRIIFVHGGQASLIKPNIPTGIGHLELDLSSGDSLIMVSHATHAQLPLGSVAALAREELTPQGLCRRATAMAVTSDPLSHHAVMALTVATTTGESH